MINKKLFQKIPSLDNVVIITDSYNQRSVKEYFSSLDKIYNYQVYTDFELRSIAYPQIKESALLKLLNNNHNLISSKAYLRELSYYLIGKKLLNKDFASVSHSNELNKIYDEVKDDVILPNELIIKKRFENKNVYTLIETPSYEVELTIEYLQTILGINIIRLEDKDTVLDNNKYSFIKCNSIHEEIDLLVRHIGELLEEKVNLKDICIGYSDEIYLSYIINALTLIKAPYVIKSTVSLKSFDQIKKLIKYLKEYQFTNKIDMKTFADEVLDKNYLDIELRNIVIKIFNKYVSYDVTPNLVLILIDEINNRNIFFDNKPGVVIVNNLERSFKEKYLIYLGTYNGSIPVKHEVNSYFSEEELKALTSFTLVDSNNNSKIYLNNLLNNLEYTYFTCSNRLNGYLMVSPDSYLGKPRKYSELPQDINIYFKDYTYQKYEEAYDDYRNYRAQSETLCSLDGLLKDNRVEKYNNNFTGVSKAVLEQKMENKSVSYTQIDNFYSCPFKYYLNYYWQFPTETTDSLFIGDLFHEVMENLVKNKIELEDASEKIIEFSNEFIEKEKIKNNFEVTKKFEVFLTIYQEYMFKCYKFHQDLISNFLFDVYGAEVNANTEIEVDGYQVKIIGKLDKVLKYKNYYMVIDYKTGKLHLDFDKTEYGLNLQLPFYLFLLNKKLNKENFKFMGAYLQQVLPEKVFEYKENETFEEQCMKNLRLQGMDINKNDDAYSEALVNNVETYIKKVGKRLDKKIDFTQEELKIYIDYVEELIIQAIKNMIDGNFEIKSITFDKNKDESCSYCKFKGICYRTNKNVQLVKKDNSLKFLFGNKEEEDNE